MSEMKTAAYICSGCGLGDQLDIDATVKDRTKRRQDGRGARTCIPVQS